MGGGTTLSQWRRLLTTLRFFPPIESYTLIRFSCPTRFTIIDALTTLKSDNLYWIEARKSYIARSSV